MVCLLVRCPHAEAAARQSQLDTARVCVSPPGAHVRATQCHMSHTDDNVDHLVNVVCNHPIVCCFFFPMTLISNMWGVTLRWCDEYLQTCCKSTVTGHAPQVTDGTSFHAREAPSISHDCMPRFYWLKAFPWVCCVRSGLRPMVNTVTRKQQMELEQRRRGKEKCSLEGSAEWGDAGSAPRKEKTG